jgi:hypothetical protein
MGILTLAFLRCWWRRFARRLIKRKQRRWQQSESQQQRQQFLFHNPYLPQKLGWHHSAPANWQIATHASPCSGYRSLVMRESNESLGSHRSQLKLSRHDRLVSAYRESNAKAKVLRPRNYLDLVPNLVTHLTGIIARQKESGVRTPLSLLCGFRFTASVRQQESNRRGDAPSDVPPRSHADEAVLPISRRATYSGGHPSSDNQAATCIRGGEHAHSAQQPEPVVPHGHKPAHSKPQGATCKLQVELRVQFSSSRKLLPQ